ncbi:methyl-accepting chemotaxis protein [Brachyspira hyodysenteriae]|uniref:methyl-accepting chemotaxis protein n=1 Tax=Brachyspira hyodysenteriae TaxID=159 RepID=UPI0022CD53F9|nr:methyl-accepting chemotaxis protein [Brachyspira hyodysenteriae]MCZ9963628.1 methyl-accepting chemotaxis protein [Brachyspira hyodysenteriae]MDA0156784.1 methyl-accepting chemotaxis protein [Brachyspira hyodysenteriae]
MLKKLNLNIKISLVILLPLIIMLIISNIVNIIYVIKSTIKLIYSVLDNKAKYEVVMLKSFMYKDAEHIMGLANTLSGFYNDNILDRNFYEKTSYNFLNNLPNRVNGLLIAFEPNIIGNDNDYINSEKYGVSGGRFNYYLSRDNDTIKGNYFDNKIFQEKHYTETLKSGELYITDVYSSPLHNNAMIYTWSVPIKSGNRTIGVISIDVLIESIYDILENIKLFKGTTTTLFDNSGFIVYDSDKKEYIFKELHDIYPYYRVHNVFENIINGKNVLFQNFSGTLKKYYTYSFTPMEITKNKYWGLKVTAPDDEVLRESNIIRNVMISISLMIIIIISIIVPIIIKTKVSNLIKVLANDITSMSQGDLTVEIPKGFEKRYDEWGDIARGWTKAMYNFNNIINTVKHSAEQVSTAANQVLVGNNDLSQRTETQASSLEETAASMNEMASAIKESAESVSQSTSMVSDAKESLNKAGVIIEDSVNKMNDVYEASAKIMDITKLIEGIAFQTNILALNASVEAARAGDQGRGFAVVASEVRNLAQNTQESVKSITSLITDSNDKIKLAASSVQESQTIFNEILEKMDRASSIMDRINIAAQEQEKGIDQVNAAISNMDASVQKNAALVSEAASASESLLGEANDLLKAIAYFNLKND